MNICDKLIDLRMLLTQTCDGFSLKDSSKSSILSTRIKILHQLSCRDLSPSELIDNVCIAKSNLANILKTMIRDKVVDSYKNLNNGKNIYYTITPNGIEELKRYKETMLTQFKSCCGEVDENLENKLNELILILKGNKND